MADSHKFGARGSYAYAKLEDFDAAVTVSPSPEVRRLLRGANVALV